MKLDDDVGRGTAPEPPPGMVVEAPDPPPATARTRWVPVGIVGTGEALTEAARAAFLGAGGGHAITLTAPSLDGLAEALVGLATPGMRALVLAVGEDVASTPAALGRIVELAGRAARAAGAVALLDVPGESPARGVAWVEAAVHAVPVAALGRVAAYHPAVRSDRRVLPAAAAVAGALARAELKDGPWGSPFAVAGVPLGGVFPAFRLRPEEEILLRGAGINPVRTLVGVGAVAWGDSLLGTGGGSLTAQVALAAVVRELHRALAWSAFESDGPGLRARLRREAQSVLRSAWEAGVLDGDEPARAFAVALGEAPPPEHGAPQSPPVLDVWLRPARGLERVHVRLHPERPGAAPEGT
ncbi:hypothetical protein L6R50_07045 [Myxococcota bacterium]|nr:hypothetical protein [Myxococcota bacterium]